MDPKRKKLMEKWKSKGEFEKIADKCNEWGKMEQEDGSFEKAIELFEKGVEISEDYNLPREGSFCERSLCEIFAILGKREKCFEHAERFKHLARKCNDKSQEQLSLHVQAWCFEKLFDSGNADREDLVKAIELAKQSRWQVDKYSGVLARNKATGTVNERKANLLTLEARLYQLLGKDTKALEIIQEARELRLENPDIKYDIMLTECGLVAPEKRLGMTRQLVEKAPDKKKGNSMIEYSHQLVLNNQLLKGYDFLVKAYMTRRKNLWSDDLNDLKIRLPILWRLKEYGRELKKSKKRLLISELYEAIADLYDKYFQTLTEKEKKEYKGFVMKNIVENYEKMIENQNSRKEESRGLNAIGLVLVDLEEYRRAIQYFEKRLAKFRDEMTESEIIGNKISILKCKCNLLKPDVDEYFEECRSEVQFTNDKKELLEVWSDYQKRLGNVRNSAKFREMADGMEEVIVKNEDDETDKLFEKMTCEKVLEMCEEDYDHMKSSEKLLRDKDKRNPNGETNLHEAAKKDDWKKVERLCKMGYEINAKDNGGWTPLTEAITHGNLENVRVLLEYKADLETTSEQPVDDMDGETEGSHFLITPLMDACCNGFSEIARILIRHGARLEKRDSAGWTAWNHFQSFVEQHGANDEQIEFGKFFQAEMERRNVSMKAPLKPVKRTAGRAFSVPAAKVLRNDDEEEEEEMTTRKRRQSKEVENFGGPMKRRQDFRVSPRVSISPRMSMSPGGSIGTSDDPIIVDESTGRRDSREFGRMRRSFENRSQIPPEIVRKSQSPTAAKKILVKFHFIVPDGANKVSNIAKAVEITSSIADIKKQIIRKELENSNYDFDSIIIWKKEDPDKCVLSDELCLEMFCEKREISLECKLAAAPVVEMYKKVKDPIPEVINRLETLKNDNFLDFSNLIISEEKLTESLKLLKVSTRGIARVDLSRQELGIEDEMNLRDVVKGARSLVLRATSSVDGFERLFEENETLLEDLKMSAISFREQNQISLILGNCPNLKEVSLIGISVPRMLMSPVVGGLRNLQHLTHLNLSHTTWASDEDWSEIFSSLENLRHLEINNVKSAVDFKAEWLPNLQTLIARNSQLDWDTVLEWISVSNISHLDLRGAVCLDLERLRELPKSINVFV